MSDSFFNIPIGVYTADPADKLGKIIRIGKDAWIYTRYLDAVTYTTGMVCSPGTTLYTSTNDVAGGTSGLATMFSCAVPNVDANGNAVTAVPAQNNYGWGKIAGYHSAIRDNGDDDIAQYDTIIMVATDGVVDSVTSGTTTGTLKKVGIAAAADIDADNTVAVILGGVLWVSCG